MRKKHAVLRSLGIGFSICALLFFGACGNPLGDEPSVPVSGVSLAPANPSVALGTTLQLQAVISPENATDKTLVWTSSAPSIAAVSATTGLVTPYAVGTAVITATSVDGPYGETTVTVTATAASPVEGITLTGRGTAIDAGAVINMASGDSLTVSAAVHPAGVDQTVNWTSGNPAVAAVSDGTVTAVGAGDAIITVIPALDPGKTVAFTVHVVGAAIPVTGITLDQSALNLTLGGADAALAVSYAPADTTQTGVTWSSSNPAVATVANGAVHAVGAGTAVITAASIVNNAVTASVTVNVAVPVTGIALDQSALNIIVGGADITLAVSYAPANTTQTGVTWSSSNAAVATVTNGAVHAAGAGTAVITAASTANNTITARCTVTVTEPLPGISLSPNPLTINGLGNTGAFTVVYNPADTAQTGVTWSSSDTSVAAVDPDTGVITAAAAGSAIITAVSTADNTVTASAAVNVVIPVTGITLDQGALNMLIGGADVTLAVTYTPAATTQTGVTWSSSDTAVATVSTNGTVHAAAAGTAVITAASAANSTVTASCTVTVTPPLAGISLSPNPLTITGAGATGSFTVTYNPAGAAQTGVTWSSSNPATATVSGGTVTAVAGGTATITATSTINNTITASATVNVVIPVTGITLDQSTLNLTKGGTGALSVSSYTPSGATQRDVTWSSSNHSVATVSNGTVTAVGGGTATITATSAANSAISASATVNVTAPLAGIRLSPDTLSVGTERTGALTVVYDPPDTTQKGVSWSSSVTGVATVTGDAGGGKVTGVGAGEATITVTSTVVPAKTASATVTVFITVPITGLSLDEVSLNLNQGTTGTLTPTFAPSNTTDTDIKWSSSNTSVATVSNGTVTAKGGGTADITATSTADDTLSATCTVTVTVPLTGISLSPNLLTISGLGNTGSFTVTYDPTDTTQTGVTWSSDTPAVATVDPDTGEITAEAAGTAEITATSKANNTVTARATVNVVIPVTGITLNQSTLNLNKDGTGSLSVASYIPPDTTQTGVTWSSSNPSVATVDPDTGQITAKAAGSAVITATSVANDAVSDRCDVTVTVPITELSIPATMTLGVGGKDYLNVTYTPSDTTQTGVTWSSSDDAVATVNPNTGEITAVANGTATITATSKENSGISASCALTVQATFNGARVSIVFEGLEDETFTLDTAVNQGDELVITAPDGFNRYLWYMDGGLMMEPGPVSTVTYPVLDLIPGRHYITVIVEKDGYHFSKTLIYTVGY